MRGLATVALKASLRRQNSLTIVQNIEDEAFLVEAGIVPRDRVRLVRGAGVDTDEFHEAPFPTSRVVLLASRMLWDKGVGEFVEAARRIRSFESQAGEKPTRMLAVTANVQNEDRDAALAAGLDGLLVKPLDRERLREVLEAMQGRAANPLAA